jgi:TetR/AcrR family transcriptional regulator
VASRQTRRRTVGRPTRVHSRDARENLLDAAVRLFADKGVAGTTVAEIAAAATVTAAMVHYYFKNRTQLVDAVAAERLEPILTSVWAPVLETHQVGPMLAAFSQRVIDAAETHTWLPSLWLREIVVDGGQLRTRLLRALRLEYVQHLIRTVSAAQRDGSVSADLDPRLVFASVLGLTLLPLAGIAILEQVPGIGGIQKQDVARHARALLDAAFARGTSVSAKVKQE